MSETMEIIWGLLLLVIVFVLTRFIVGWKLNRAAKAVFTDLKNRDAVDAESAVVLPYARQSLLKMGMRDYRKRALESLVSSGIVGMSEDGRYFLRVQIDADGKLEQ